MNGDLNLPYLLDYSPPMVEDIAIFCVAMLTAILVSAEGQGFVATLLGDSKVGAKDRLHFNVFLHMSLPGTFCFFIAGFGWAKELDIDRTGFKRFPGLSFILSRLAGPLANLLMANIAASLSWILTKWGVVDNVFSTIVIVNITMAVYNMIPLPPLPGSAVFVVLFDKINGFEKLWRWLNLAGPFIILGIFLFFRLTGFEGVSAIVTPVVVWLTTFSLNI
ncbi:site-2 protease family protein [Desulforhopalus sp. IMCC35007]|uniref:site-2 protease family protein n=1 Tax=Desulforhopalus sp. IMCC35007 TaxID=2569543 RepID=UPI0010AECFAA|nr:site-2 protease family protein [Desulforhopalus sp. IMCC35007]TKB09130.1 site-2 protease family protein [Desulforhopalus sp. IMCC35007]